MGSHGTREQEPSGNPVFARLRSAKDRAKTGILCCLGEERREPPVVTVAGAFQRDLRAYLERSAANESDDDDADDAGQKAHLRRDARGNRDTHAERQGDEKDDERSREVARQRGRGETQHRSRSLGSDDETVAVGQPSGRR
jgi:hypothetical protein